MKQFIVSQPVPLSHSSKTIFLGIFPQLLLYPCFILALSSVRPTSGLFKLADLTADFHLIYY